MSDQHRTDDEHWLGLAVDLAVRSVTDGGGPFGAVVAGPDGLVATGHNRVTLDHDPTAHAEVVALRAAGAALGTFALIGYVLYASCEPCPMCLGAALWSRVDRVIHAADRRDAAQAGFDDDAFHQLFTTSPAEWPMPVTELRTPACQAPFEAWTRHEGRTDY